MSSLCRWSIAFLSCCAASAQTEKAPPSEVAGIPVNYDEARVGTYTLPDEGGASLRGSGWKLIGERGGGDWSRPGRPRTAKVSTEPKLLWEVEP